MSRDDHRNFFGNAVADHISYPSSAKIMEQQPFVFFLATARLAFRTRHDLASFPTDELADSRRATQAFHQATLKSLIGSQSSLVKTKSSGPFPTVQAEIN